VIELFPVIAAPPALTVRPVPIVAALVTTSELRVATPELLKVVKAPVPGCKDPTAVKSPLLGVVAPIAVVLIPVPVVLKNEEVIVKVLAPIFQVLGATAMKFKAPALVKASVPLVNVEIVRLPDVLVQEEVPPLAKVKTDVELPMLIAVVLGPIFSTPVESSEELLTPTSVRVPVVLPMTVLPVDPVTAVLIFRLFAPVDQVLFAPAVKFNAPALVKASVPLVTVFKVKGPVVTCIVKPPVVGPVMVLAAVPEKRTLLPNVVVPVMMVLGVMVTPVA
jgi:hypothetical protein